MADLIPGTLGWELLQALYEGEGKSPAPYPLDRPYEYVEWLRQQQGGRCTCGKCEHSR